MIHCFLPHWLTEILMQTGTCQAVPVHPSVQDHDHIKYYFFTVNYFTLKKIVCICKKNAHDAMVIPEPGLSAFPMKIKASCQNYKMKFKNLRIRLMHFNINWKISWPKQNNNKLVWPSTLGKIFEKSATFVFLIVKQEMWVVFIKEKFNKKR